MRDKMHYFLLGFASMGLVAMLVLTYYPTPLTEQACQHCNDCWWFELAEGDE